MSLNLNVNAYLKEAVKIAAAVAAICLVLGAVLPALGAAGISVPTWASVVIGAVAGAAAAFQKWAKDRGITAKTVLASVTHRTR